MFSIHDRIILLLVVTLCLSLAEPALANKFVTIGSGISGDNRAKYQLLQAFAGGIGAFLILLGVISLIPKLRGSSELKVPEITSATAIFLFILGGALLLISQL